MSTSQSSNPIKCEGRVVKLQWKSLVIVLRPVGGKAGGGNDVSTPSLLHRAGYEHFVIKPAQFHNVALGTRATYEIEEHQSGAKIAFNFRHECNDKWEQWERQQLEELAHPEWKTYTRAE